MARTKVTPKISSLHCTSVDPRGSTTIVSTGSFAGYAYLNITDVSAWGMPFSQQARVEEVILIGEDRYQITLFTMLTGGRVYLEVSGTSKRGYLSSTRGDRTREALRLKCSAQIDLS